MADDTTPNCPQCGLPTLKVPMGRANPAVPRPDAYACRNQDCPENHKTRSRFPGEMPTRVGDVLVLANPATGLRLVGAVAADGQQGVTADHHISTSEQDALAKAAALLMPGGRVFLWHEDDHEWERFSGI